MTEKTGRDSVKSITLSTLNDFFQV